jgi:Mn2+/Fe2+ NRAMP family transporter
MGKKNRFGPGFLVAAAFIGPGTITSSTLAGARFGFGLIWVVVIATLAAIVLQEMVGRFSLSTGMDVASALVKLSERKILKYTFQILAFTAIIVGCAAYEAGNIIGGSLGLNMLTHIDVTIWSILISFMAVFLLIWKNYILIERLLIALVVLMGLSFFISAMIVRPDFGEILKGFIPRIPDNSLILILALLGTTVVPYNLFLHSAIILKKWKDHQDIPWMRKDTLLSIGLGGAITISVIVTASVAYYSRSLVIQSPVDLSLQLAPLYGGKLARVFLGIGFFSAGLSSAITAPYAAAWTAAGLFGWKEKDWRFSLVFLTVIGFGMLVSMTSLKPLQLIVLAQVTNALLLPLVSVFIFYLLNKKEVGKYRNNLLQNILFLIVFLIVVLINIKKFF